MSSAECQDVAAALAEHIKKLLMDRDVDGMPEIGKDYPDFVFVHDYIMQMRDVLDALARGNISVEIPTRGFTGATLKGLQASLLHLTWQIQQVGSGDLSCQIDHLGEFSSSFNDMVTQLDEALTSIKHKEEDLRRLADKLQDEVILRGEALNALRQSEANFKYMASHDPLTGVLNRRSFFDTALAMLREAGRTGEYCTIVLFDLDDFKRFNDTYGHLDGDQALRHVTTQVSGSLRKKDIIGRYGGEEFICLFPMMDAKRGHDLAERLRERVAKLPVSTQKGEVRVTISAGFVSVGTDAPGPGEARDAVFLEKVLRQVDGYLYKAKRNGKNRVEGGEYRPELILDHSMGAVNPS